MSKFYTPVDIGHTALLISDVQEEIISRFPKATMEAYLARIATIQEAFRSAARKAQSSGSGSGVPLIVHQVLPFGINSNGFVSPYNKISLFVKAMQEKGMFKASTDPNFPRYSIPEQLKPDGGWGSKDEIIISKIQPGCFASSDLLAYLRARDIHHVVLVGLTTVGSILGSARHGADLDFHIIIPREGVMDDDDESNDFLLDRILPRFCDVVTIKDVLDVFEKED